MIKLPFRKNFLFIQIRKNYTNTADYRVYRNSLIVSEYKEKKKKELDDEIKKKEYRKLQFKNYLASHKIISKLNN